MNRRHFFSSIGAATAVAALPGASSALAQITPAASTAAPAARKALFTGSPRATQLRGYAGQDVSCERAAIEGRLPAALRGVFYRNGPALFERGFGDARQRYEHWFDGDGMVHAWRFTDKGVSHQGRFVQTKKFLAEQEANAFLAPAFGSRIQAKMPVRNSDDVNPANTNVYKLGDRLLAMWEGGSATAMDPQTLETKGIVAWAPELKHMPFSAHPKVDPDGTFWNFGTLFGKMIVYHISAKGDLIKHAVFDAPSSGMVHDFAVTHRHLVFLLPPIDIDRAAMRDGLAFGQALRWNAQGATRVLVIDRNDFSKRRILEMPPFMVFHFGNAWEANNVIRVDFVRSDNLSVMNDWMPRMMRGESVPPDASNPAFVTIDLNRGKCDITLRRENSEFPRVDPRVVGLRNRNVYYPVGNVERPEGFGFTGVMRLDVDSGKVDRYDFREEVALEEHIVVPKPGSAREGEGWLVGVGFDVASQTSFATVFDALNLAAGPEAIVRLPYWAPTCFHGHFHA
jgi:all-trans-8'-apo-beta-carotenal 15,15'-oxygenase